MTENIKVFLEADAQRTQGEWINEHDEDEGNVTIWAGSAIHERHTGCYDTAGEMRLYSTIYCDGDDVIESDTECLANATFIAAASRIAPDLAQMVDDLRGAREALEFYRNLENYLANMHENGRIGFDYKMTPVQVDSGNKARQALTRLKPYEKLFEKEGERE